MHCVSREKGHDEWKWDSHYLNQEGEDVGELEDVATRKIRVVWYSVYCLISGFVRYFATSPMRDYICAFSGWNAPTLSFRLPKRKSQWTPCRWTAAGGGDDFYYSISASWSLYTELSMFSFRHRPWGLDWIGRWFCVSFFYSLQLHFKCQLTGLFWRWVFNAQNWSRFS